MSEKEVLWNYRKWFLKFIYSLDQEFSEKWKNNIEKDVEKVFSQVLQILEIDEFLNISFDKMLTIFNTIKYKEQFKTNIWFLKILKKNWGFSVNVDLWNYCNHECSHYMISASHKKEQVNIDSFLEKMDNIPEKYFSKLIKEISFYGFGEFLDHKDFDKIFEYFLKRWVNNFNFVTRWPYKEDITDVFKKIIELKNKYNNFNLGLVLSFDDFSNINKEINMKNLVILYLINKNLFKNKYIEIKPTISYDNYKSDYNSFIKKLNLFLNFLKINYNNDDIIYKENWEIEKIKLDDWFEIRFLINFIKPLWRWKKLTKSKFDNSWLDLTDCFPITDPFSFSLDPNWNLKTCFAKDIKASLKYSYSNIEDKDFMKKFIKIKRDFFKNIKLEDLVWKWDKHFCMAVNLLQKNKGY